MSVDGTSQTGNAPHSTSRGARDLRGAAKLPGALLLLLILGEAGLSLAHEQTRAHYPPETHHDGFTRPPLLARAIQGWTPVEPTCAPGNCYSGYDAPPKPDTHRSGLAATRWLWDSGGKYDNRYPLFALPAALCIMAFPGSIVAASLGPRIWMALLLLAAYTLGKSARGPWTGLLGATVCAGMPGLFGLGMIHQDHVPLAAIATTIAALLLSSEGYSRRWRCAAVGALGVLAFRTAENISGMILVSLTVAAPFVYAAGHALVGPKATRLRALPGLMLAAGPFVAIAAATWIWNEQALDYMTNGVGSGVIDGWFGNYAVFPFHQLGYIEELWRDLLRLPLAFFVLGSVVCSVVFVLRSRLNAAGSRTLAVLGMSLVPLLALSPLHRKALWYIVACLPSLGVVTALGFAQLRSARLRVGLGAAVACVALAARIGALEAPSAARDWLARTFPKVPAVYRTLAATAPINVLDGRRLIPPMNERRVEAASAASIIELARSLPDDGAPVRVLVLSTYVQDAVAMCWMVHVGAPYSTCFSPMWGGALWAPPQLLEADRYDILAYVAEDGLRPMALESDAAFPGDLALTVAMDQGDRQDATRIFLDRLHEQPWQARTVPTGTLYVRSGAL